MLWGKKILAWSETPVHALRVMIELNDRYALDGRDPSSYTGIFWVLGRHDRPWAPERPVFGTVRFMSSANAARKMKVGEYVARYGPGPRSSKRNRVPSSFTLQCKVVCRIFSGDQEEPP